MSEDYIRVLKESLEKKVDLLNKIVVRNEQQKQLFESDGTTPDELESNIEAKGRLVDQIVALDDGFEQLFKRVEQELSEHREEHKDEIREMQELIRKVTELSAKVESQEQRNRNLASSFFAGKKKTVKHVSVGTQAVSRYYQNMMQFGGIKSSRFMETSE